MDGGSIFCESKSQRVLNSIGNYMGMTIEEKYHPFVRNYLSPYIFTTYNLDAPELSIYKYEMKISPTTRKLHFKIIPKSIPPFVISLTIILGTILFIQLNFGMFAWTKTRMFWNTELPLWKKIPLLGLGIFVETGISGIALTFLRHALSCAALSTFFSTLEYSADVKFTGS
ncbi:hypothetical protein C9374_006225 [Naegleria lovaniensis]|uniref:Uncharacterized protein n=1 Tax=Naegleria lovaniensis TaxID=51637 RepID=A0AA88GIW9_NAELO|nr:uncharacterized protein C9374_006225 [Naegleria lovaniensis]KAG2381841.1 hypothetical protein C9374_006225 [Naegleria lovaniensis]